MTEKKTPPVSSHHSDDSHLDGLADKFMVALNQRRAGKIDDAVKRLREILKVEPRLAEPHMELASIFLAIEKPDAAVEHAREATRLLENGSQWTDDLPENVVQSLAWNLLGEALRQVADKDEVVFGPPETWNRLMVEAKAAFKQAAELDPENAHATWSAFGFGSEAESPEADDEPADVPTLDLVDLVEIHNRPPGADDSEESLD